VGGTAVAVAVGVLVGVAVGVLVGGKVAVGIGVLVAGGGCVAACVAVGSTVTTTGVHVGGMAANCSATAVSVLLAANVAAGAAGVGTASLWQAARTKTASSPNNP
jgi:hypothetical protein